MANFFMGMERLKFKGCAGFSFAGSAAFLNLPDESVFTKRVLLVACCGRVCAMLTP